MTIGVTRVEPPFAELFEAEERHFWFRARKRVIEALAQGVLPGGNSSPRILEIGCGTGNILGVIRRLAPGGILVGMDLFLEGLRFARRRNSGPLVQADVNRLPFRGRFDLICLFDVLEHISDDLTALRRLHSLLRAGGSLLITVPAHMALWSNVDEASGHHRRYSPSGLRKVLQEAGFDVPFLSPFMAPLIPLIWLRRKAGVLLRPRGPAAPKADRTVFRDLRVVPVFNGLLERLLGVEAAFVARRLPIPFGASLIAHGLKREGSSPPPRPSQQEIQSV